MSIIQYDYLAGHFDMISLIPSNPKRAVRTGRHTIQGDDAGRQTHMP